MTAAASDLPAPATATPEPAAVGAPATPESGARPTVIGVLRETADGENRVALVPEVVATLISRGFQIIVQPGAGTGANCPDEDYASAGADLADLDKVYDTAGVLLRVGPPSPQEAERMRPGQLLAGVLQPLVRPPEVEHWAERGLTTVSLDLLPRTLSRVQTMDALSSQANVAGYKAALRAADAYGGYFPMLMTAAGTVKPAQVLVLGAGVAGLQAIATARRLGAIVWAYDVRPAAKGEVESLGARFVDLPGVADGATAGGYARELTAEEQDAQRAALDAHIARCDIVITTAQVPGRTPPMLVSAQALAEMGPGSVVLDGASGPHGGNVAGSVPGRTIVTDGGVTLIGADNLPSEMAAAASRAYAKNLDALCKHLMPDGVPVIDTDDEVTAAITVTHAGGVVSPLVAQMLAART